MFSALPLRTVARRRGVAVAREGVAATRSSGASASASGARLGARAPPASKRGESVGAGAELAAVAVVGNHDQVAAGKARRACLGDSRRQVDRRDRRLEGQPVLAVVDRIAVRARRGSAGRAGRASESRCEESGRAHGGVCRDEGRRNIAPTAALVMPAGRFSTASDSRSLPRATAGAAGTARRHPTPRSPRRRGRPRRRRAPPTGPASPPTAAHRRRARRRRRRRRRRSVQARVGLAIARLRGVAARRRRARRRSSSRRRRRRRCDSSHGWSCPATTLQDVALRCPCVATNQGACSPPPRAPPAVLQAADADALALAERVEREADVLADRAAAVVLDRRRARWRDSG